jgi:hypothetical protein
LGGLGVFRPSEAKTLVTTARHAGTYREFDSTERPDDFPIR